MNSFHGPAISLQNRGLDVACLRTLISLHLLAFHVRLEFRAEQLEILYKVVLILIVLLTRLKPAGK